MLSIVNEVDPLIFHCVCFVCDTNMCFSNSINIRKGFKQRQNVWNKRTKEHKKSELGFLGKYLRVQPKACICRI